MKKIPAILYWSIAVTLSACGTVSDVVAVSSGTYIVSSHGVVGNGAASAEEVKAIQSATVFCRKKSQALKVISVEKVDPFFGRAPSSNVRFQCENEK
jgi:hypothetical protein